MASWSKPRERRNLERPGVFNEVGLPYGVTPAVQKSTIAAEIVTFAIKSISENEAIIENEFLVVKKVYVHARTGD